MAATISVGAAASVGGAPVTPARVTRLDQSWLGAVRLDIALPEKVAFRSFVTLEPPRLIVDVAVPQLSATLPDTPSSVGEGRAGTLAEGWSRIVLTLNRPVVIDTVGFAGAPGALSLQVRTRTANPAEFAAQAALAPPAPGVRAPLRGQKPGMLRVVLDPGHGGIDPGATRAGVAEKDIALSFAIELARQLRDAGGFEVLLTRDSDRFVLLNDRVAFARAAGADVFMSLHANTVTIGAASGATVYVGGTIASDPASAALAMLENRSDSAAGMPLSGTDDDVTAALYDMARGPNRARARSLAQGIVDNLDQTVGVIRNRPLRSADFRVLRAPDVPSVLLELGFLSDAGDRARMTSPAWQAEAARALVAALAGWRTADTAFLDGLSR